MKPLTLQTIAGFCNGRIIAGDGSAVVSNVSTDSRKIGQGDLFVALVGEKFDAHDFLPQVAQAGATAVVISRELPDVASLGCAIIQVPDTLIALQSIARGYRKLLNPLVIGITGSNGKTSTKDFLAALMMQKFRVAATVGNLNNHIGVPLSILAMAEDRNCAVLEMGMNHAGEIAVLANIALPDVAVITNVGIAHIENLGSREGIAEEKGSLAAALPETGLAVLNANDDFTPKIRSMTRAKVVTAGVDIGDVCAAVHETGANGSRFSLQFPDGVTVEATLPVPGRHMVGNAALAAACAWSHGITQQDIASGLSEVKLTKGRVQIKKLRGVNWLDDSYNANPDSMRAGLQTLAAMNSSGRKIAVLGRMGELGTHAAQGHRDVGECAARCGIDAIFTIGEEASQISDAAAASRAGVVTKNFSNHQECAAFLRDWLREGDAALLKGSRLAGMEQVLAHLENA